jgi:hypothetical protein
VPPRRFRPPRTRTDPRQGDLFIAELFVELRLRARIVAPSLMRYEVDKGTAAHD